MRLTPALLLPITLLLTACGIAPTTPDTLKSSTFSGSVHGGQQPVAGATIQLYTVGTTADQSNATPLLIGTVTTDASGYFNITGRYTCLNATQVYITATGGNPGLAAANNNLALMTALGPCTSLTPTTFISINELTTVAAVYALAPYTASATSIGSSPSDASALTAAMTTAGQYVSTSNGMAPGNPAPTGDTNPTTLINTLGDIIAPCINSLGGTASDTSTPCGQLFALTTIPGQPAPTNTLAAILNLALNSTLNTTALFNLATPSAPFQPTLNTAPPDFNVRFAVPASQQALQITPATLTFPSTVVNYPAATQPVTITNTSSATITINAITPTGVNATDFTQTNNCGASLIAAATCTAQVTYIPTAAGTRQAYLAINSSAPTTPQYVTLTGTAVTGTPHATFTSGTVLNMTINGAYKDVNLTNTGTSPLAINSLSTSSPYFPSTNNCGASLAINASCIISILNLAPAQDPLLAPASVDADVLTLISNDPTPNKGVQIIASNTSSIGPANILFPGTTVGTSATTQLTALFGSSTAEAVCNTVTPSNPVFKFSSATSTDTGYYGAVLYEACAYTVTFTPTALGLQTVKLPLEPTTAQPDGSYITLTGTGTAAALTAVQLSPTVQTFSNGATPPIGLLNQSAAPISIQSIAVSPVSPRSIPAAPRCQLRAIAPSPSPTPARA